MANLINADPTAGLKLVSSSSSDIQIQSNGVTVCTINADGLSMNTGTLAGNGPAFSAYKTSNQTISVNTWTKSTFTVEEWDTNSNYDTTNSRFLPTVAGYYQMSYGMSTEGSSGTVTRVLSGLYKNGLEYKLISDAVGANVLANAAIGSTLVYLNGSTDYVEVWIYIVGGTPVVRGTQSATWFTGCLVRSA